jgi:hypothetical protein
MKIGIVKINETEYWDKSITDKTGKIYTYYIFNTEEITHCCSLTGSYWLIPVDFETENSINDELWEEIYPSAMSIDNAGYYDENLKPDRIEEEDWEDIDEAIEHYMGNPPYYELTNK